MKNLLTLAITCFASAASAGTPASLLENYTREAAAAQPAFNPSAQRGAALFARRHGVSATLPSCAACHGEDPRQGGRHVVTGKPIAAMSPAVAGERFSDPAKVEKWFRRNCTEVVGRECSAAEKSDLIAYFTGAR